MENPANQLAIACVLIAAGLYWVATMSGLVNSHRARRELESYAEGLKNKKAIEPEAYVPPAYGNERFAKALAQPVAQIEAAWRLGDERTVALVVKNTRFDFLRGPALLGSVGMAVCAAGFAMLPASEVLLRTIGPALIVLGAQLSYAALKGPTANAEAAGVEATPAKVGEVASAKVPSDQSAIE